MRIYGLKGDVYTIEYTVSGSFDMRSHRVHIASFTSDVDLENKLTAAAALKSRCSTGDVKIYQVFREIS